jgi:hypothetical protein
MLVYPERLSVKRKYFFSLTSRFQETFGVFNRLFRDIEIHGEGAAKKSKALRGEIETEP